MSSRRPGPASPSSRRAASWCRARRCQSTGRPATQMARCSRLPWLPSARSRCRWASPPTGPRPSARRCRRGSLPTCSCCRAACRRATSTSCPRSSPPAASRRCFTRCGSSRASRSGSGGCCGATGPHKHSSSGCPAIPRAASSAANSSSGRRLRSSPGSLRTAGTCGDARARSRRRRGLPWIVPSTCRAGSPPPAGGSP